jgi:lipopolysaccharide transport system permease protein
LGAIIAPSRREIRVIRLGDLSLGLPLGPARELFRYRELVASLVVRDLKVRYKSSVLGFVWSLLNPILMMLVFYVVFTVLLARGIQAFPLFILSALLPWHFFATSVAAGLKSVVAHASLVKKVYFPREVLPLALVLANLVNFLLAIPVLIILMVVFAAPFTWNLVYFPLILVIELLFVLGVTLALSAIYVFFRDTEVIVEVLLTAWFFLTPIFYRMDDLTQAWHGLDVKRIMYIVNPMASIIESFRLIFYNGATPDLYFLLRTLITSLGVLAAGYWVFVRLSHSFGEEL